MIRYRISARYFYPRSPCGERQPTAARNDKNNMDFYPRSPCGERRVISGSRYRRTSYFYPRSPCGERLKSRRNKIPLMRFLSTLSLRRATDIIGHTCNISAFLSTLSLRRATHFPCTELYQQRYFYPRSPCGERRNSLRLIPIILHFYPRSPCGERQRSMGMEIIRKLFLSTLSLRRATK